MLILISCQKIKPGIHLIVTIVTVIAVIIQKQSISAITERSLSHVHLIILIVQKTSQDHFLGAKPKSARNEPVLQCTLGKYDAGYDDCSDRS